MSEGGQLGLQDFPQTAGIAPGSSGFEAEPVTLESPPSSTHLISGTEIPIAPAAAPAPTTGFMPTYGALAMLGDDGEIRPLEKMESETIRFAIAHYRGQMSEVARRLKIGRSTLYRKLEQLGLSERPAAESKDASREEPVAAN